MTLGPHGGELDGFTLIPAIVGERVEEEFKLYEEEILPILERTPPVSSADHAYRRQGLSPRES